MEKWVREDELEMSYLNNASCDQKQEDHTLHTYIHHRYQLGTVDTTKYPGVMIQK